MAKKFVKESADERCPTLRFVYGGHVFHAAYYPRLGKNGEGRLEVYFVDGRGVDLIK